MPSHSNPDSSFSYDIDSLLPPEDLKDQPTPVMIAVMGATGSGKSTFINRASGSSLRVGTGLESCTEEVNPVDSFLLDGVPVTLIDTPGFDDTSKSDTDILKLIAAYLASTYEKGSTLAGVIYIHRISDRRFTGIAGRNFKMFRDLCGDTTLKNVVLVTNMWGDVSPTDGEARETELSSRFFKPVLDKQAQMIRHQDSTKSAHDIIRRIMKNHPEALQIQRELVDEHKDITDTAAGAAVNQELTELIKRHQDELKELREGMEQAFKEKDDETRHELAEQAKQLQVLMEKTEKDKAEMSSRYAEEKKRMEAMITKMEEEAKEEKERAKADRARMEREAKEERERARADQERMEREAKADRDRMEREAKEERERARADRERMEREAKEERERARADQDKMEREAKADRDRMEREAKEERDQAKINQDRIERDVKDERERAKADQDRMDKELKEERERAKADRDRMEREAKAERDRMERELKEERERAKADRDRMEREAKEEREQAKANQERIEREVREEKERAKADRERMERDAKADRERMERDAKADRDRIEREAKAEQDKLLAAVKELENIKIPIHSASGDEDIRWTGAYPGTSQVSSIRERLVEDANRGSSSDRNRSYVEVILKGKEEGQFLEDSTAPHNEMLKGVLKLVYWTRTDIDRKVRMITANVMEPDVRAGFSKRINAAIDVLAAATRNDIYYRRLLTARSIRDTPKSPDGKVGQPYPTSIYKRR